METVPSRFKGNRPGVQASAGDDSAIPAHPEKTIYVRFPSGMVVAYGAGHVQETPGGFQLLDKPEGNIVAIIPHGTGIIEFDTPLDIGLTPCDELDLALLQERDNFGKQGFLKRFFNF